MSHVNFDQALLLDPMSGTAMSQDHQMLAQAIADRYPTVRLAQIPLSERANMEEYPFALIDRDSKQVIRRFKEHECNIRDIFEWLYWNDSHVHGVKTLLQRHEELAKKEQQAHKNKQLESLKEQTEFVHWLATSPMHEPKHDGVRYGV